MSKVVTFNIHHGAPVKGAANIRDIASVCEAFDADLIALQEVDILRRRSRWRRQPAVIAAATGHHLTLAPTIRRGLAAYGTALLTREPPKAVQFVGLPAFGTEPRIAILASVPLADRMVSVAAVHLQATRGVSEIQLGLVLDQLLRRPAPHLILGDLNMESARTVPILRRRKFVWAESGPTFPAQEPKRTIDWIATRGCPVGAADVPDTRVSDHRPLVARLG